MKWCRDLGSEVWDKELAFGWWFIELKYLQRGEMVLKMSYHCLKWFSVVQATVCSLINKECEQLQREDLVSMNAHTFCSWGGERAFSLSFVLILLLAQIVWLRLKRKQTICMNLNLMKCPLKEVISVGLFRRACRQSSRLSDQLACPLLCSFSLPLQQQQFKSDKPVAMLCTILIC